MDDLIDLIRTTAGAERAISKVWLKRILNGDFQHLKEYLDRRDGKVPTPAETVEAMPFDWSGLDNECDTERPAATDSEGSKPVPDQGEP